MVGEVLNLLLGTARLRRWLLAVLEEEESRSIWLLDQLCQARRVFMNSRVELEYGSVEGLAVETLL